MKKVSKRNGSISKALLAGAVCFFFIYFSIPKANTVGTTQYSPIKNIPFMHERHITLENQAWLVDYWGPELLKKTKVRDYNLEVCYPAGGTNRHVDLKDFTGRIDRTAGFIVLDENGESDSTKLPWRPSFAMYVQRGQKLELKWSEKKWLIIIKWEDLRDRNADVQKLEEYWNKGIKTWENTAFFQATLWEAPFHLDPESDAPKTQHGLYVMTQFRLSEEYAIEDLDFLVSADIVEPENPDLEGGCRGYHTKFYWWPIYADVLHNYLQGCTQLQCLGPPVVRKRDDFDKLLGLATAPPKERTVYSKPKETFNFLRCKGGLTRLLFDYNFIDWAKAKITNKPSWLERNGLTKRVVE